MRWLDSNTDSMDMNLSKLQEMVKDGEASVLQSKGWQRVGHDLVTEQQKCIGQGGTQKRLTTKLAERGGWGRGTHYCPFKTCGLERARKTIITIAF